MLTNVSPHVKLYSLCPLFFPRFPSTSPLKPIPCPAPAKAPSSIKKRPSFRDKEAFFRFRSIKKQEKETQVCIWILKIWCIIKTSPISCFQGKMPVYSFKFEVWSKCKKKKKSFVLWWWFMLFLCLPGKCRSCPPIRGRESASRRGAGAATRTDGGGWTGDLERHHPDPV